MLQNAGFVVASNFTAKLVEGPKASHPILHDTFHPWLALGGGGAK